ncbi:hypothetical protein ONZ45_g18618 [Pleurotus djamor]|nr:hypothetical protein ONZ45_g18618 [Pleurotus djamor]
MENQIIGLTDQGHVVKFCALSNESAARHGHWDYLPKFSDVNLVRAHPVFKQPGDQSEKHLEPPSTVKITHISGHFRHFAAYSTGSSSLVLMGDLSTAPSDDATILPALQYKSIISVVVGDYHYGALTSTGKLYTWGAYSLGALGLGDPRTLPIGSPGGFASEDQLLVALDRHSGEPPAVEVPTEVRFDHGSKRPQERFCFAVTASGWHMGALVIDLEPESQDDDDDTDAEVIASPGHQQTGPVRRGRFPVPLPRPPYHNSGPGQVPILPLGHDNSVFRVGYPGRGTLPGLSQQGPSTSTSPTGQQEQSVPGEIPYPTLGRGIRIGIKVTFKDAKGNVIKSIEGNEGDDLLSLAHEHDIDLEGACERSCACSTCHVILPPEYYDLLPEPEDDENDMLDMAFGLTDTSRLGCQVILTKELDGITATLPSATRNMFVDGKKPTKH